MCVCVCMECVKVWDCPVAAEREFDPNLGLKSYREDPFPANLKELYVNFTKFYRRLSWVHVARSLRVVHHIGAHELGPGGCALVLLFLNSFTVMQ